MTCLPQITAEVSFYVFPPTLTQSSQENPVQDICEGYLIGNFILE